MLDFLFSTDISDTITISSTLTTIISSLVLGFIISASYMIIHKEEGYSKGFTITLVMLPVIIGIIILLVGSNIARAFSLAGAFSLIRFRSAPGDPKDIAYVFFSLAAGLGCGIGLIGYAAIFTLILSVVMIMLNIYNFGSDKRNLMRLKILVPEDLNYEEEFNEILDVYTNSHSLIKFKTTDFGALYELVYIIELKENVDKKEFVDKLRLKNGNLQILLAKAELREINV